MKIKLLFTLSFTLFFSSIYLQSQTLEWGKSFGGSDFDSSNSTVVDDDGNVFTVGGFQGIVDFDPGNGIFNLTSNGDTDVFVQKLDENGNFLWAKSLGSAGFEFGSSIAKDSSGNIYVVGSFTNTVDFDLGPGTNNITSNGINDLFLIKLSTDGDTLLIRTIGGIGSDLPYSIEIDSNNSIIISGGFQATVDFDPGAGVADNISPGGTTMFILKLDSNADYLWAKSINAPTVGPFSSITVGRDIDTDSNNNVYVTGRYSRNTDFDPGAGITELLSNGLAQSFILKLDSNGDFIWARSIGNDGLNPAEGEGIAVDDSGNIYATGRFTGTTDFDPGIGVTNLTSLGNDDTYITKLDTNGNLIWAKSYGSPSQEYGHTITVDNSGNVYLGGFFQETVSFNTINGTVNLTSDGTWNGLILKFNSNGNITFIESISSTVFVFIDSIFLDSSNNFYVSGYFENDATLDFGNSSTILSNVGDADSFVVKISQSTLSNINLELDSSVLYFPNPVKDKLTIVSEENFDISVYDLSGKIVKSVSKKSKEISFSAINLTDGVYFLKGENSRGSFSKKIIINKN